MKRFFITYVFLACSLAFVTSGINAQVPAPASISEMAVYKVKVGITDSIPDYLVNYNITSPVLINSMITGIESDTLRDCSLIEAKHNAFLYVKFLNGTRQVYHLFTNWTHFSKQDDRNNCYYITPASQALFKGNAQ